MEVVTMLTFADISFPTGTDAVIDGEAVAMSPVVAQALAINAHALAAHAEAGPAPAPAAPLTS
jgi:hypothetical protein